MSIGGVQFVQADVFASGPYQGNSLGVVYDTVGLDTAQMLAITQELRHFETIFVEGHRGQATPDGTKVRVFDLFREISFAGHPTLGVAATLHHDSDLWGTTATWTLHYPEKTVPVTVRPLDRGFHAEFDAGHPAEFVPVPDDEVPQVAAAFGLKVDDLHPDLPMEVGSIGLCFLVVPVASGLDRASVVTDLEPLVTRVGAELAYLVDVAALEGRHWNNDGVMEDPATGSAGGLVGAYLVRHGRAPVSQPIELRQGRFVGRPSTISVTVEGRHGEPGAVRVAGDVHIVSSGIFAALPEVVVTT